MSRLFRFRFKKDTSNKADDGSGVMKNSQELVFTDEVFDSLRNLIYSLCGIYYSDSKKYLLEGRITKRVRELKVGSFEEYFDLIKSKDRGELNSLFDTITINESYFFRAEHQFDALEKTIIPGIIGKNRENNNNKIRIWCGACSTGEEAYTIAILVKEKLEEKYPDIDFQILASDISNSALDKAREGKYKEYSIRKVEKSLLEKYFTLRGDEYEIDDEIKKMVKFTNINLYDDEQIHQVTGCDIILCCNVLIYFDIPSKQKVVTQLFDALNKGGYLMIGYSESLHCISRAFKLIHLPKAIAYKKE